MRLTFRDAENLCDEHFEGFARTKRPTKGECYGCRLSEELCKPATQRNKRFLRQIEGRVITLRQSYRTHQS